MHNQRRKQLRQENRDRLLQGKRRGRRVAIFTKITNHINHTNFANALALTRISQLAMIATTTAIPHAYEALVGVFQHGKSVGNGGGYRQSSQSRLAKTEVRYLIRQ